MKTVLQHSQRVYQLAPCVRTKKRCIDFELASCHFPFPERAAAITDESQLIIPSHSARGDEVGANVAKAGVYTGLFRDPSITCTVSSDLDMHVVIVVESIRATLSYLVL
jgi:hypothetical protein